jgi:hypothetical protein
MDAGAILHELTHAEGLPREALKAASAQRVEMLPLFLKEIETYLALEPAERVKPTPLFFIFHLLGEWREKTAYGPLGRLLRLPGHEIDAIFGDGITTTSHRVMAAVFDGDPEPLYDIILDPNAEEFIRAGMCEVLAMVTLRENSIGVWQAGSSVTSSWRCARKPRASSGSVGRAPLRCSA